MGCVPLLVLIQGVGWGVTETRKGVSEELREAGGSDGEAQRADRDKRDLGQSPLGAIEGSRSGNKSKNTREMRRRLQTVSLLLLLSLEEPLSIPPQMRDPLIPSVCHLSEDSS